MALIDDLLEQLTSRTGAFSPLTPFKSERTLQRYLAPAVAKAGADIESANIAAGASNIANYLRAQAGLMEAREREQGATVRQGMADKTSLARQELVNIGNQLVQKLANEGIIKREEISNLGAMDRLKYTGRMNEKLLDDLAMMKYRLSGLMRGSSGNAVDIINQIESDRNTSGVAKPNAAYNPWSFNNYEDDYDLLNR